MGDKHMITKQQTDVCTKCKQEIDLLVDSWSGGKGDRQHVTCPISPALANVPSLAAPVPATPAGMPEYLTIAETAGLFRCSSKTVRRMIADRRLRAQRVPTARGVGNLLVSKADAISLLQPA
jgi:excisionase family DNA binding protein